MEDLRFSCCFTGHRQIPVEHMEAIYRELDRVLDILIRSGVDRFLAGGALGFDTLAALTVLDKKEKYPHIRLELCVPCRGQDSKWSEADKQNYRYIYENADKVTVLNENYTPYCMHQRNRYMVDNSDYCVAYCTESRGGSAYTVEYAQKSRIKVINLGQRLFSDNS